ncbi:MAG: hypothetical protein AB7V22_09970 [Kiritimatiellia bacterium]
MNKRAVLLVAALIALGSLADALGSGFTGNQQVNITYQQFSYWAFIHDYTTGLRESNTPGFIAFDTELAYVNQSVGVHVAYIYLADFGRYTTAQAFRHVVYPPWIIYDFFIPIL